MTWKLSGSLFCLLFAVAAATMTGTGLASAPAPGATAASADLRDGARATGVIEGVLTVRERPARRTADRYGGRGAARPVQTVPPVVYLAGSLGDAPPPRDDVVVAQEDTSFAPPLLVIPVGTTVGFPNRDPFFHNVFSYSSAGRFDLGRYPRGESKDVHFDEPGVVKVYCEVHESMRAAVVVVENRYWAEPAPDGTFRIEDVPAGTHTLVAWHTDRGEVEREVQVTEGGVARVELEL